MSVLSSFVRVVCIGGLYFMDRRGRSSYEKEKRDFRDLEICEAYIPLVCFIERVSEWFSESLVGLPRRKSQIHCLTHVDAHRVSSYSTTGIHRHCLHQSEKHLSIIVGFEHHHQQVNLSGSHTKQLRDLGSGCHIVRKSRQTCYYM